MDGLTAAVEKLPTDDLAALFLPTSAYNGILVLGRPMQSADPREFLCGLANQICALLTDVARCTRTVVYAALLPRVKPQGVIEVPVLTTTFVAGLKGRLGRGLSVFGTTSETRVGPCTVAVSAADCTQRSGPVARPQT